MLITTKNIKVKGWLKRMGRIIYAFPASGKTFLCEKNEKYIELASEDYHWCNIEKSESGKGTYSELNKEWQIIILMQ